MLCPLCLPVHPPYKLTSFSRILVELGSLQQKTEGLDLDVNVPKVKVGVSTGHVEGGLQTPSFPVGQPAARLGMESTCPLLAAPGLQTGRDWWGTTLVSVLKYLQTRQPVPPCDFCLICPLSGKPGVTGQQACSASPVSVETPVNQLCPCL